MMMALVVVVDNDCLHARARGWSGSAKESANSGSKIEDTRIHRAHARALVSRYISLS